MTVSRRAASTRPLVSPGSPWPKYEGLALEIPDTVAGCELVVAELAGLDGDHLPVGQHHFSFSAILPATLSVPDRAALGRRFLPIWHTRGTPFWAKRS